MTSPSDGTLTIQVSLPEDEIVEKINENTDRGISEAVSTKQIIDYEEQETIIEKTETIVCEAPEASNEKLPACFENLKRFFDRKLRLQNAKNDEQTPKDGKNDRDTNANNALCHAGFQLMADCRRKKEIPIMLRWHYFCVRCKSTEGYLILK